MPCRHSPAFCIGGRGFCGVLIFFDSGHLEVLSFFLLSASVLHLDLVSSFIYYRLSSMILYVFDLGLYCGRQYTTSIVIPPAYCGNGGIDPVRLNNSHKTSFRLSYEVMTASPPSTTSHLLQMWRQLLLPGFVAGQHV